MSTIQYVLGIFAAAFTFGIVVEMLRRRQLRERHAIWWLLAGLLALIASIFPGTLIWAADLIGFEVPINLVFFISLFILFLVALQHSSELTKSESHNRVLSEEISILKIRVESLEQSISKD
jgi:hypothetical protein